jgi:hypothetical protein
MKKSHIHLKSPGSLFNEFVCKLGFFWHEWAFKILVSLGPRPLMPKKPNLYKNGFFCSTSPLKAPNRLESLKLP